MRPAKRNPQFAPTLQGYTREAALRRKKPWNLDAYRSIAIFGGILPLLVMSYVNGKRLNMSRKRQTLATAIGLLGLLSVIALAVSSSLVKESPADIFKGFLFTHRMISIIVCYIIYRLHLSGFRVYCIRFCDDKNIFGSDTSATAWTVFLILLQEVALYSMMVVLARGR